MIVMSDQVSVATVYQPVEIAVIRSLLESHGIAVLVKREALGDLYGLTIDGLARSEIMVHPEAATEARALIESALAEGAKDTPPGDTAQDGVGQDSDEGA